MKHPDRMHSFNAWLRMLLEDLLVIDAASIYVRRTKGAASTPWRSRTAPPSGP